MRIALVLVDKVLEEPKDLDAMLHFFIVISTQFRLVRRLCYL